MGGEALEPKVVRGPSVRECQGRKTRVGEWVEITLIEAKSRGERGRLGEGNPGSGDKHLKTKCLLKKNQKSENQKPSDFLIIISF